MWVLVLALGCSSPEEAAPNEAQAVAEAPSDQPTGSLETIDVPGFIGVHGDGVQLVDVRTDGEWAGGRIPGAIHVPLDKVSADHPAIAGLDKSKPVYFVCAVGGRSGRAADRMSKQGFHAVNVMGGTKGWITAGKPVEKD